ncbi:hypothetical protein ABPG75_009791 [Micractinium tetrahymenae]
MRCRHWEQPARGCHALQRWLCFSLLARHFKIVAPLPKQAQREVGASVGQAEAACARLAHSLSRAMCRSGAMQHQPGQPGPPLLGVAVLQLETRPVATEENLAHVEALLDRECARLGIPCRDNGKPGSDDSSGSSGSGGESVHMDILLLPEIFNTGYLLTEAAWYFAESLADSAASPTLRALSRWAARYCCYAGATLLEATADGHIYNSFVLAAPNGTFVRRPATSAAVSTTRPTSSSVALVRKHRASSLEGFVFRSAGGAGRGGEPEAHIIEIDAAPLLAKRSKHCSGSSAGSGAGQLGGAMMRLGVSVCYENFCLEPMRSLQEVHLQEPLDLLLSPFCAMQPAHDHPTFKWPRDAAERFAASAAAVSQMHAAKLGVPVAACHHTGQWAAPLPRLLPFLPTDAVPLSGPMLGCSAIYAPGGSPLARLDREQEGMALVQLPLLQCPRAPAAAQARTGQLAGTLLAGVLGVAAVASADAGPAAPYASYAGGYIVEPASWEVKYGFRLMEALGALSYNLWQGRLRRRVAQRIAAGGVWRGPMPPLDARTGGGWGWALVAAAAAGAALASMTLLHRT